VRMSEPGRVGQFSLLSCAGRVISNQFSRMARNRTGRGEEGLMFGVLGIEDIALAGAWDWRSRKRAGMVGAGSGVWFCATERIGSSWEWASGIQQE